MLMNTHEARLDALRGELKRRDLDGFVIPISDEHMSEYVGAYAQRLSWLTGFEGSAGTVVVLTDPARDPAAAIFVDGRYTLQVRDQVDGKFYAYESVPETSGANSDTSTAPAAKNQLIPRIESHTPRPWRAVRRISAVPRSTFQSTW